MSASMLAGLNQVNDGLDYPKKDDPDYVYTEEVKDTKTTTTTVSTWKAKDGSSTFTKTTVQAKEKKEDPKEIEAAIKKAVEVEDYELAAKLKKKLK